MSLQIDHVDFCTEAAVDSRQPNEACSGKGSDAPGGAPVANFAFDVMPARLVSGLITERGVLQAERAVLAQAFPERTNGG